MGLSAMGFVLAENEHTSTSHTPTEAHPSTLNYDNFCLNFNPKRYHAVEPAYDPAFAASNAHSPFPNYSNSQMSNPRSLLFTKVLK
jgi:hypothetical protein